MTDTYQSALTLLAVGMITVFLVLILIVIVGQILTRFTNRFAPKAAMSPSVETEAQSANPSKSVSAASPSVASKQVAAIVAAVELFTQGKGKITNIQKLN